jgi:hypothetical protein
MSCLRIWRRYVDLVFSVGAHAFLTVVLHAVNYVQVYSDLIYIYIYIFLLISLYEGRVAQAV